MKSIITLLALCIITAGCTDFATGVGTGAAAMAKLSADAQDKFIAAVNDLNAETEKIKSGITAVEGIGDIVLIKPETKEAVKTVSDLKSDPIAWIAGLSVLANMFWGGSAFGKRKTTV